MGPDFYREIDVELPAIPEDGLLLHIGVHKSGTTSLQDALRRSREILSDAHVFYQGPHVKGWGVIRPESAMKDNGRTELDESVPSFQGRVVVSTEFLCTASKEQAAAWVARLGADRPVRVMVTIRSLADLLPSTWQQKTRARNSVGVASYEKWLQAVLTDTEMETNQFWRRNNYPRILRNWGRVVGEENITFVVAEKTRHDRILRVTERLLDLPVGSLSFGPPVGHNRSMSYPQAELLRQVTLKTAGSMSVEQQREVRKGIRTEWRRSGVDEDVAPIPVPDWAADAMRHIGVSFAGVLEESPATVVGDIDTIAEPTVPIGDAGGHQEQISIPAAVAAVVGAIKCAAPERAQPIESSHRPVESRKQLRMPRIRRSRSRDS